MSSAGVNIVKIAENPYFYAAMNPVYYFVYDIYHKYILKALTSTEELSLWFFLSRHSDIYRPNIDICRMTVCHQVRLSFLLFIKHSHEKARQICEIHWGKL